MIRPYEKKDEKTLEALLEEEGWPKDEHGFNSHGTMVYERGGNVVGFFTHRIHWGRPYVVHFCVGRDYRSSLLSNGLRMFVEMEEYMKQRRTPNFYLGVESKNQKLKDMIERFSGVESYAEAEGHTFYLVEA